MLHDDGKPIVEISVRELYMTYEEHMTHYRDENSIVCQVMFWQQQCSKMASCEPKPALIY